MEVTSRHHRHHHGHPGEEKHLMLSLNRRLESYLGRVQQLEEENEALRQEIHVRRQSGQGVSTRRRGLEKELRLARQEVEAVWQERDRAELEVGSLVEELEALAAQRQRVAQAQAEARRKLDDSRKEMEVEQRAQTWLREKVRLLEQDIELQIQAHQEEVAHQEATLTRSPPIMARPPSALTSNQMPSLLQLGQEYSQRAASAWQEATEAYQVQLGQLEESLSQARHRLVQVDQEKSESQLKLHTLQKELASAQDVRQYLEKSVFNQRDRHGQELQQLQDHLEGLEAEKEELSQHIDGLLVDSRGLLQLKMSLDLEVAAYRALLDNESLRGDISSSSQMRHLYIPGALSSPRWVKRNDQGQMSTTHMSFPLSSIRVHGRPKPTGITTASIGTQESATINETLTSSQKTTRNPTDAPTAETPKLENMSAPYPKILQSGNVENFRPQEIHEEVSYAEPLSLPDEQEVDAESLVAPLHSSGTVAAIVNQIEFSLSGEPLFNKEPEHHQYNTGNLAPYSAPVLLASSGVSEEHIKDVPFEVSSGRKGGYERHAPIDAWVEKFVKTEEIQDETSESETEALIELTFDTSTTSPASECEPEDGAFNQSTETDSISNEVAGMISHQEGDSIERTNFDDKLYPDGEEMDSWDSVIERKMYLKKVDSRKVDESETQHAKPDEDISSRELEHDELVMKAEVASVIQNEPSHMTFTPMHTASHDYGQLDDTKQHYADQAEDDNDEEEDSQNVSVSWKTELESDSYAQDNTVADTRPLIRYKSDETDTTQASHVDETESSEGEEDRKVGETGVGKWNESKSKRFGTMEDLCEDVEGAPLGEDYDLGYTAFSNYENTSKDISDEETEELTEPVEMTVISHVDCDEELERVDKLVEQELEHLSTATYSMHFAEQQAAENKSDNRSVCSDHNSRSGSQVHTVDSMEDESSNICQHSQPVSTTHVVSDEEDLLDAAVPNTIQETVSFEVSSDSLEHSVGKRADCLAFSEVPQTAEWEVLERPSKEIETRGQFADDYMYDDVHESTQSYFHNTDSIYQGTVTQNEESSEASPERIPVNTDIFPVKDSNKYLKTNEGLHDFVSSGMKDDFWGSNLETGASYQPDDFDNHTAEQSNQNLQGFSNTTLAWGDVENPSVANGHGRMETDTPKPLGDKEEQRPAQVKQLCRDVAEGEKGHSMYSEDEGESWSSGEE